MLQDAGSREQGLGRRVLGRAHKRHLTAVLSFPVLARVLRCSCLLLLVLCDASNPIVICTVSLEGPDELFDLGEVLLHAHVIREDDAPEHQSKSLARSAATRRTARARGSLRGPLRNKKRKVGKGLSLADTQTGR